MCIYIYIYINITYTYIYIERERDQLGGLSFSAAFAVGLTLSLFCSIFLRRSDQTSVAFMFGSIQSCTSKVIGRQGMGSFCQEFLCFKTMSCRHLTCALLFNHWRGFSCLPQGVATPLAAVLHRASRAHRIPDRTRFFVVLTSTSVNVVLDPQVFVGLDDISQGDLANRVPRRRHCGRSRAGLRPQIQQRS